MEQKQFNVRMPLFSHEEFAQLRLGLRELGSKPTDGDLIAALIHEAVQDVETTKQAVETFVIDELARERSERA